MTPERADELKQLFDGESERLLGILESLTSHESPSNQPGMVSDLSRWIVAWLLERGLDARAIPCPPAGDSVLVHWGACGGKLLVGHVDTVWPAGTLDESPFSVDADRIRGPGVFDMKAGLAVILSVCDAVAGGRVRPSGGFSIFLTSDEEIGTTGSKEALLKTARDHSCALVLEPSGEGGAVKIARKGIGTANVDFVGVPAHAGLEPEKGASALLEMSRYALFASLLSDAARGTAVSPTVARAGDRINVIPERASLIIDFRAWTAAETDRVLSSLAGYVPLDERVSVLLSGGLSRPAMEPSPGSLAMYETARSLAARLGFVLSQVRVGGGSDGSFIAALGVPTLDGLGPSGGGAHARSEHVLMEDLTRRAALLASLLEEKPWPLGC